MPTSTKKTKKKRTKKSGALPRKSTAQKQRAKQVLDALYRHYPDAHCELDFRNPTELLVAVILSAQSTDTGVNKATPELFDRFKTPADYAQSTPEEIESYIKTIGLYRNKARAIHAAMTRIVEEYDGAVPDTMEDLLTLRGVARKTANVVLGEAFGKAEGIVVDTHVMRVAKRLGLTKHDDPGKVERDLMALFPREHWTMLSHLLIWHGRRACKARGALCSEHPLCQQFCSNAGAADTTATKNAKKKTKAKTKKTMRRKRTTRKT